MHRIALCLIVLLTLAGTLQADTLTLKEQFIVGWKYSFDGKDYSNALFSPGKLKEHLGDDSTAIKHVNSFVTLQYTSLMFLAAGATVAVIELGQATSNEWESGDDLPLTIAGAASLIIGFGCESLSGRHLKKAAARYNEAQAKATPIAVTFGTLPMKNGFGVGVLLRF